MEYARKNTVKVRFGDQTRSPSDGEMVTFVARNMGIKPEQVSHLYQDPYERCIVIKFANETLMKMCLEQHVGEKSFGYSNGQYTKVMITDGNEVIKYVRLFYLPPEVPDQEIAEFFKKFGVIKKIVHEKRSMASGFSCFSGVRGIYMDVTKEIPPQVYLCNYRCRVFYSGMQEKCFVCKATDHLKPDCPHRTVGSDKKLCPRERVKKMEESSTLSFTNLNDLLKPKVTDNNGATDHCSGDSEMSEFNEDSDKGMSVDEKLSGASDDAVSAGSSGWVNVSQKPQRNGALAVSKGSSDTSISQNSVQAKRVTQVASGSEKMEVLGCVAILSVTWILCLTCFGLLVLPKGYYFNKSGLLACEPFYSKSSYRILSSCALYFPTTMVLMYCYGSSFHANRYRLATPAAADSTTLSGVSIQGTATGGRGGDGNGGGATTTTTTEIGTVNNSSCAGTPTAISVATPSSLSFSEKLADHEQRLNGSTSRTMAAISLGFIVIITPWTIQEIVATCTGSKIPTSIDFCVTWIALSSSFWNPFLYWLLNARFRRICKEMLTSKCTSSQTSLDEKCSISLEYDHHMTTLPLPPGPPPATICRSTNHTPRPDIECPEKYWDDVLERTFSTGSINALHRSTSSSSTAYHQTTLHRHHHRHRHYHPQQHNGNGSNHHSSNSIHKSTIDHGKDSGDFTVIFPTTNSDPAMSCEHELHDINCAKNRAFFLGFNHHQALPDT